MYLPVDPLKTENILQDLERSFSANAYVYSIFDGNFISGREKKTLSIEEAAAFIARLRNYQYIRIGTARLQPVPPHYGIDYVEANIAELKELISLNSERMQLLSDISKVVQLFFYQEKEAVELRIPGGFNDLLVEGFSIEISDDGKSTKVRLAQ